jgi:putative FmdB family regulatory protein
VPIYEFYCSDCHTIFNFFSSTVATDACPVCPQCGKVELPRRPSTFATLKHQGTEEAPTPFDNLDETKLEGAMATLAQEMGDLGEDEDPRRLGAFFRRFGELSGLELGPRMEDALRRLESGEDIESLEDEMGDDLDDDESMEEFFKLKKAALRRRARPKVDDTLYFL